MTFDRGFEVMGTPALDREMAVASTFCDPRSPWQQKGVVENANGRLRLFPPSDVPLELLITDSLQALTYRFNAGGVDALATARRPRCFTGAPIPPQAEPPLALPCRIWNGTCKVAVESSCWLSEEPGGMPTEHRGLKAGHAKKKAMPNTT